MQERYKKNLGTFIQEDTQLLLLTKKIAILGCGGNGQYVAEFLARLGVQGLSIWDGDRFEESNLNRQPMMTEDLIGCLKTVATQYRLNKVNSAIEYKFYNHYFTIEDYSLLLQHDLIVFCTDNSNSIHDVRQALHNAILAGIPVIDAGIHDRGGYVSIITSEGIDHFDQQSRAWECGLISPPISQPAYLCGIVAGLTVSEIVKWFAQERSPAINQRIHYDINANQIHRFDFHYGELY